MKGFVRFYENSLNYFRVDWIIVPITPHTFTLFQQEGEAFAVNTISKSDSDISRKAYYKLNVRLISHVNK